MTKKIATLVLIIIACGICFRAGRDAAPQSVNASTDRPTALIVPHVATPVPANDLNIDNPTGILLGEVKVPDDVLRGPTPEPAPGIIVPTIIKR